MPKNSEDSSDGLTAVRAANTAAGAMNELARRGSRSLISNPPSAVMGSGGNLVKAAAVVAPAAVTKAAAVVAAAPMAAPLAVAAAVGGGVYGAIKLVKWLKD